MPELPAVEYSRRLLEQNVVGGTITKVTIVTDDPIVFEGIPGAQLARDLQGHQVSQAERYGKYLWLCLQKTQGGDSTNTSRSRSSNSSRSQKIKATGHPPLEIHSSYLLMHFGMTGFVEVQGLDRLHYQSAPDSDEIERASKEPAPWPPRFCKLIISLDHPKGQVRFAFGDARRLGRVRLLRGEHPQSVPPVSTLGFDPLIKMPSLDETFYAMAWRKAVPLKSLLLDQTFAAGVGNWMADDIMLMAGIHPQTRCDKLSESQVARLHHSIYEVTRVAVEVNSDGTKFPPTWLFHRRWPSARRRMAKNDKGHPAVPTIEGHRVEFISVGGRTTAYVPDLQLKGDKETLDNSSIRFKRALPPSPGTRGGKRKSK